jgi:signal peptidase I
MHRMSKKELFSWGKAIILAILISIIAKTLLFAPYVVEGASMEPTLHNHERIVVSKFTLTEKFNRGDIVIINGNKEYYVKRIIGLPGDKILIKNDKLFINGELHKEPYLAENRKKAKEMDMLLTGDFGPIIVPKDKYFVMGDNRLVSMDSRNGLGLFQKDGLVGESKFVFFPFNDFRTTD